MYQTLLKYPIGIISFHPHNNYLRLELLHHFSEKEKLRHSEFK